MRVVVALGGNALLRRGQELSWGAIISGDATLAEGLRISLDASRS